MDIDELERRLGTLLPNLMEVGDDGVARMHPEFAALEKDVANALDQTGDHRLSEVAEAMKSLREMAANPDIAASMAEAQSVAREPNPPIFDAIEDGDIEAARAALADWDINRGHGKYEATPLYHAMSCGHGASLPMIAFLLDQGADPRKGLTDTNVLHGLGFAGLRGVDPAALGDIVRRCVALGADIEERTNHLGWTPLICAASEWNPVATEALLLAGADITARAGARDGVCSSGATVYEFADGDPATTGVLQRFAAAH